MRIARYALVLTFVGAACSPPDVKVQDQDAATDVDAGDGQDAGPADAGVDAGPPPICSLQVFAYPLGYACNSDGDCLSGHCAVTPPGADSWPVQNDANPGICSTTCETDGSTTECPTGYACGFGYNITSNSPTELRAGLICLPQSGTGNLPSDRSLPTGSPCWKPTDCAGPGAVCGSMSYGAYLFTFCAHTCDDQTPCGDCAACTQPFNLASKFCTFSGPGPIGTPCVHNDDCASNFCDGFCTQVCSGTQPCPSGSTCYTFMYNNQSVSACINPAQVGASAPGASCTFDFECDSSSVCANNSAGNMVCTRLGALGDTCTGSTSCQSGLDCRQFTRTLSECSRDCGAGCGSGQSCYAPDLNTELRLYNGSGSLLDYNDDVIGGNTVWSRIDSHPVLPGTYAVAVRLNRGQYRGNYKLRITDDLGTPTQVWRELPESPTTNDTQATAQTMPFPVELYADLHSPSDIDYFTFQVTQSTRITLETSPGAASACLPSAQVASRHLGDSCAVDFNCQSGLTCDTTLLTCTKPCVEDADCGGAGATCQSVAGVSKCAAASQVGQTPNGQTCTTDWQCAAGSFCVVGSNGRACATPCITTPARTTLDAGTEDGGEAPDAGPALPSCDLPFECAMATTSSGSTLRACLPPGNGTALFGAACVLQSDCASGLACLNGRCGKECSTTDECPFHPSFAEDPIVCKPCTDTAQCTTMTEEGACVTVDANELFCALPCDANGKCPAGFACQLEQPVDSYSSVNVCEPINGSCHAPVCNAGVGTTGTCEVRPLTYAELCTADSECSTGKCAGGFCTKACVMDADCGCPQGDLVCSTSVCAPAPGYLEEIEPNEATANSQLLTAPMKVRGSLKASGNDIDTYTIALHAGQTLNAITRPVCGVGATGANTYILLYSVAATGESLVTYVTGNGYSRLRNYAIPADGTYAIKVEDGSYPPAGRESAYILEVTTTAAPQ